MTTVPGTEVYQLHVWIRQISPMIWRRLLVRSDSTIADLHYTIQIALGWTDAHFNLFHIHGQDYGVYHDGGISFSHKPDRVKLSDFKFRTNERFRYEYDFGDRWQHEVRVEHAWRRKPNAPIPAALAANGVHHRKTVVAPLHSWRDGMKFLCNPMTCLRNFRTVLKTTMRKVLRY